MTILKQNYNKIITIPILIHTFRFNCMKNLHLNLSPSLKVLADKFLTVVVVTMWGYSRDLHFAFLRLHHFTLCSWEHFNSLMFSEWKKNAPYLLITWNILPGSCGSYAYAVRSWICHSNLFEISEYCKVFLNYCSYFVTDT